VAHFGDAGAEYRAAREACALFDSSGRDVLRVTGEDRVSFLQGMVTNDVAGLPERGVAYAAMLTAKGAMVSDAWILKRRDDVLLDTEPGFGAKASEFLNKYLISEDAEIHDAHGELAILSLLGPTAEAALKETLGLEAPSSNVAVEGSWNGVAVWALPPALAPGVDVLVPRTELERVYSALAAKARPIGFEACEVLRVEAGIPRYGQDLVETTIPLEANLERAIHYNKGCYIGQEVIARATFRGHVNRKLTGLLLGDKPVEVGAELERGGKKVGWVTSTVRSEKKGEHVALAYVHRDSLEAGTELQLSGAQRSVRVHALPF
jgi:folate-binding protein YgfZ